MTTAKSKTKLWPPIHKLTYTSGETAWQVACMVKGKRIREAFPTKEEAEARAAQIRQMVDNEGAAAFSLPADTRAEAAKCTELLKPYGATITEACHHFVEKVLKFREAPAVAEAVKRLLVEKEQKNLRPGTLNDLRHRWGKFAETFGTRKLNEITGEDLTAWLVKQAADPVNRHNYRRKIGSLYRLAVKRKWTAENIVEQTERPEMGETGVGILHVKQIAKLLEHADDHELLPFAVLGFFTGVRPDELKKLEWSAVNLARRQVVIGPKVAKTKQQRILPLNDTALAWLAMCAKKHGSVVAPINFRKRFDAWRQAAGIRFKNWPKDCIRHSFGTYHYAAHNNPVETARLMGHVGVDIFFRHYRALVDEDEAKQFWALRPGAAGDEKIVPMVTNQ
jgi:integrase/recombinase XerD